MTKSRSRCDHRQREVPSPDFSAIAAATNHACAICISGHPRQRSRSTADHVFVSAARLATSINGQDSRQTDKSRCYPQPQRWLPSELCTAICCAASRPGTAGGLAQRGSSHADSVLGQKALLAKMDQRRTPSRRMSSPASGRQKQRLRPSENSCRQRQWRHRCFPA